MAGSDDALMGRLSGRIGNLVFYQLYGKTVVRMRPGYRSKNTSEGLKASQNDFKTVVAALSPLKNLLRFGFAAEAVNRSAWNAAVSVNLSRYRQTEDKAVANWLLLCAGSLPQAAEWQAVRDENGRLQLSWRNGSESQGHGADKLIVLLVPEAGQGSRPVMEMTTATRFGEQAVLDVEPYGFTTPVAVFTAFIAADYNGDHRPDGLSESVWAGRIEA